jgi:hypothetical protein
MPVIPARKVVSLRPGSRLILLLFPDGLCLPAVPPTLTGAIALSGPLFLATSWFGSGRENLMTEGCAQSYGHLAPPSTSWPWLYHVTSQPFLGVMHSTPLSSDL